MGELSAIWDYVTHVLPQAVGAAGLAGVGLKLWIDRALSREKSKLDANLAHGLETQRGEIRRYVERDLHAHESRLRLASELELRLHEREWLLLEEVVSKFDLACEQAARAVYRVGRAKRDGVELVGARRSAALCPRFGDFKAVVVRVPEAQYEAWSKCCDQLASVRTSIRTELSSHSSEPSPFAKEWIEAHANALRECNDVANELQRQWRGRLWEANRAVLADLRSMR